jgi:gamma-glutamyltranspeptidase
VRQMIVRADYARTLRQIADEGAETLYTGALTWWRAATRSRSCRRWPAA